MNFLLQMVQYVVFSKSLSGVDFQKEMLRRLQVGGIQGFCVGFVCAITVATSRSQEELINAAIHALQLAFCIGVYADRDNNHVKGRCLSAWSRKGLARPKEEIGEIISDFPQTYISAITDEASFTITTRHDRLTDLRNVLTASEFFVQDVPINGRFHSPIYAAEAEKLVEFLDQTLGLRFPDPGQLHVPVRSATNGQLITRGNLVRYMINNTLLEPVEWYKTLKLATNSLPPGRNCIAVAGTSQHFPPSLAMNLNLLVLSLSNFPKPPGKSYDNKCANNANTPRPLLQTPPNTPPSSSGSERAAIINGAFKSHSSTRRRLSDLDFPPHSIAVVGMAGVFPGANSVDELWNLISTGQSTVIPAPERVGLNQLAEEVSKVTWWGNFLDVQDTFDHKFFKKSSREASACDPQQRKLLEVVYEALASSGQLSAEAHSDPKDFGCYIGAVMNNYAENLSCHPPTAYATTGTGRSYLSGAISHHFGWTGPALTIDTACSSSLVAIHTACRAISTGECSRAVAGGTNIITCPHDYRDLKAAGFLSPSGQCKPFDAGADGYCRGEGVGVVVLKSLSAALKEDDHILGVIIGSATNQNDEGGPIVVPSARSQTTLLRKVFSLSNVAPEDVSYVEAHGTGTSVGDPIEVCSLREAFAGPSRTSTLYFSSIKGNIGHAEAASGVAGMIKALLMFKNERIPPQASFRSLNPNIPALGPDRMEIPRQLTLWDANNKIACVNNYGAAGSNAVVMMRGLPINKLNLAVMNEQPATPSKWPLILSASTDNSLSLYAQKMLDWLQHAKSTIFSGIHLPDILFNLANRTNHALKSIISTKVSEITQLEAVLSELASVSGSISTSSSPTPIILVFGGQDSRYVGLSEDVYKSSQVFRHHLDTCQDALLSLGFKGVFPAIFQRTPLPDLVTLHTALFGIQYSCARAWMDCGLKIDAVVGHSFGQLTSLCICGALSLTDTLKLVAGRAELVEKFWGSESGLMLALQAHQDQVNQLLEQVEGLEFACFNGPRNYVVVGSAKAVRDAKTLINNDENLQGSIRYQNLDVTHGFHSSFTEPVLPQLRELAESLDWKSPIIHFEICSEIQNGHTPNPQLVVEHMRQPVYFQHAIDRLIQKFPKATWLEAGRGIAATQLVRACVQTPDSHSFMAPQMTTSSAQDSLVDATIKLWKTGHSVQYWPFHRSQRHQYKPLSLPPYQFHKTRHWLPYIGSKDSPGSLTRPKTEGPQPEEFLSIIKGENPTETSFQISTTCERFQSLVRGHVMCGFASMPASAYIEAVSRAALTLQNDLSATIWIPTIEELDMKTPVVLSPSEEPPRIILTMRNLESLSPSWSFSLMVESLPITSENVTGTRDTTTGVVHLHERDDAKMTREYRRYDALIKDHRWQQITEHLEADAMQGKHIYRAFSQVVEYSDAFKGIKAIASLGNEAAGVVRISPEISAPPDQRLSDSPMIDSFLQFGGFLVNYFSRSTSIDSMFICHQIQHVQFGPTFSPDDKEWLILAIMTSEDDDNVSVDVYVSEAQNKKTVFTAFGMAFTKITRASLIRIMSGSLKSVNSSPATETDTTLQGRKNIVGRNSPLSDGRVFSKRAEILKIAASIADVPVDTLTGQESLPDIGVDSLGATEMIGDITAALNVSIDLSTFLLFHDINAIISHVDGQLGLNQEAGHGILTPPLARKREVQRPLNTIDETSTKRIETNSNMMSKTDGLIKVERSKLPTITSIHKSFDQIGSKTNALNYWSDIHPDDDRLVLAYVSEAFKKLGCDLQALAPGDTMPILTGILPRHQQLLRRLHSFLEDKHLIHCSRDAFVRTSDPIETTSGEQVFKYIIGRHPQNAPIRHLLRAVGPHLAACLVGNYDALQVLFGNRENKKWLEDLYREWPMLVTATHLLVEFLCQALKNNEGSGAFRILEVGAGTGGTTRHIIDALTRAGIPFEYHFTDISASLIQKARKSFTGVKGMTFGLLDIENEPPAEFTEAYHIIISTNCIHATRNLTASLINLRKMLRKDGALALIEMTPVKQLYVFDIIVGLLEGWWLFNDGRSHALANVEQWGQVFIKAGFGEVQWSDGESLEAKTVRVICGFPKARSARLKTDVDEIAARPVDADIQKVAYKRVGTQEILADIYCPRNADPTTKMPVALMIHGGSHVIFSRKDIRPPQTRLMLGMGFLPVSLDHRLCPESRLAEGPMVDVCDALEWAQKTLPSITLRNTNIKPDPDNIVVVGWSSGGQLALSTGWTAPERGLRPPNAILAFYCPTDYEDSWWRSPIQPLGAEDLGENYDVLEAVQDDPITNYGAIGAWEPLSDPRIRTDARSRIVLHMNWKAQTLPVVIGGLPSRQQAYSKRPDVTDWNALPQPPVEEIQRCSPLAQVKSGKYKVPTFLIHGTADDLIPWQQSARMAKEMKSRGIDASLVLVNGAPHICDASHNQESEGWLAVLEAYRWLRKHASSPDCLEKHI
ncbi:beta-ketoacyl synthase [Colletotrichum truncatum]|uniref:Beta-ketoacyl synthase n=1 Tax=Colletotrichum truncatum TaxID=5467 RepID=A0ACC3Z214_COLTU|nr:beta-ketoacyl synthase [Colletotrichum truncatum]KAF6781704.1 beta-ketoacyl synthase [Colletotrichum truncatum]